MMERMKPLKHLVWVLVAVVAVVAVGCASAPATSADAAGNGSVVQVAPAPASAEPRIRPSEYVETIGPNDDLVLDEMLWEGVLADIRERPDRYVGRHVVLEGFVYRSESYADDEFTVGRLKIDCCVDDAGMIGVRVKSEAAGSYEQESWVRVRGEIGMTEIYDQWFSVYRTVPILLSPEVEPIETPEFVYLYPVEL